MDAAATAKKRRLEVALRSRSTSSSMSHRLEEIVGQLMRPIHNLKQNFDIDLSLLEEYLTEMGVRRLSGAPEDFATIAMLVQQCAHIYGKKVDFYEQSVYDMVDKAAMASRNEPQEDSPAAEAEIKSSKRRKRKHSGEFRDFGPIDLEPAPNISRELEAVRQPPTLPKTYIEFERPPATERDARLMDYHGNEIGIVGDFHVNWNLNEGMIVDDLDSSAKVSQDMVVPIVVAVLDEIRRLSPPMSGGDSGIEPHELSDESQTPIAAAPPTVDKSNIVKNRKRKEANDSGTTSKKKMTLNDLRVKASIALWKRVASLPRRDCSELSECEEQVLEGCDVRWHRGLLVRALRKLACSDVNSSEFKGFCSQRVLDRMGMLGFTSMEIREAYERRSVWMSCIPQGLVPATALPTPPPAPDSDDDGFFEMSDISHQDLSASTTTQTRTQEERVSMPGTVEAWHAMIAPRVAEAEARTAFDVHEYSARVLARLSPAGCTSFHTVLREAPHHQVCRFLLATLFLANTGNVEIIKTGPPLSADGFDIRLMSTDKTLYKSANPFD